MSFKQLDALKAVSRLNALAGEIHARNQHFYHDIRTGEPIHRNLGELIALMHSELSEMLEGVRTDAIDLHLPHRKSEEVELADLAIRLFDYAGYRELDLAGAFMEKLEINANRKDHSNEERRKPNGKQF